MARHSNTFKNQENTRKKKNLNGKKSPVNKNPVKKSPVKKTSGKGIKLKKITGFFLAFFSIYLFFAFISYFFTWWMDFDIVGPNNI